MKTVNTWLEDEFVAVLRDKAMERGISVSELIREALTQYLGFEVEKKPVRTLVNGAVRRIE